MKCNLINLLEIQLPHAIYTAPEYNKVYTYTTNKWYTNYIGSQNRMAAIIRQRKKYNL